MTFQIGSAAPLFTLPSDSGHPVSLADFKGKNIILYFYPKDDTSGCTAQACDFRDLYPDFSHADAIILGVSRDPIKSHVKFRDKYALPFPLLADEDGAVCQQYGVWVEKSMYGRKYFGIERSTFLIDKQGLIQHIWRKVKVPGHGKDVFTKLGEILN